MKKQTTNLLVGATVLLDFPARWRGAKPEFQEQLKKDVAAGEHWFGQEGLIVDYTPTNENPYGVLLKDGQIGRYWDGAFTVKELPKTSDEEILACLTEIQNALRTIGKDGMELLTRVATQLEKIERKAGH